jgi:hypothetical protein
MRACCRWTEGAIVGIVLCLFASHAWGQATPPRGSRDEPPTPTTPGPPVSAYPLELLGLLAPPAQRGPTSLTPSIAVSEEYDDNLFLDNRNRQWDLVTGVSPAITLSVTRPSYQLTSGYTFTAQRYERESRLNNAFNSQNFLLNGSYNATPQLTLTASDTYALNRNTNQVSSQQGFASGRQESWNNTFGPGMRWQMTPLTSLTLGATYAVLRFKGTSVQGGGGGAGSDSDTYGLQSTLGYVLTPRLTGTIGYGFTYLDVQGEESSRTHTPTVGANYRLTPTLNGSVSGGPAFTEIGGQTSVSPAGTATLTQTLQFGTASVQYTRAVSAAGGLGGTTDMQTASGTLTLATLWRGLLVVLSPSYSIAESVGAQQTGRVDVRALTVSLGVTYQVARFASVFGGYNLLQQRTGGQQSAGQQQQLDVDQNRVRFGLQFGYPINFD